MNEPDLEPTVHEGEYEAVSQADLEEGELDYQSTLSFTQKIRRQLVGKQMEKGVPGDKDGIDTLLKTLKDMDSTAIADRRNSIEEGNADTAKRVADSMAHFIATNDNPFIRRPDGSAGPFPTAPSINSELLEGGDHVEGETFIGIVNETEEMFTKRMQAEYDESLEEDLGDE